eukprot:1981987-Amphidinium_carterae.1
MHIDRRSLGEGRWLPKLTRRFPQMARAETASQLLKLVSARTLGGGWTRVTRAMSTSRTQKIVCALWLEL